jgi:two-component system response regulator YesN
VGEGAFAIHEKMREALRSTEAVNNNFYQEDISYDSIRELNKNNDELIKCHNIDKPTEAESMKIVIRKAVEYMRYNYRETITLNDVAEHTYISACYLSRLFTKELGKSFVEYLSEMRIEKAKEFLREDNYKTYEVAEMVGIKDAHYFSKLFKKYTGITPSEFKDGV